MIYRRSHIESGKKGGRCGKSWSPETCGNSAVGGVLSLVARCLNPMEGFQNRARETRIGTHIASGRENQ